MAGEPDRAESTTGAHAGKNHPTTLFIGGRRTKIDYSKRDTPSVALAEGFDFQRYENDCEPCQIHNILSELGRRHGNTKLAVPYGQSLRLCHYHRIFGIREQSVLPAFKERLKGAGYKPRELERCRHWSRVAEVLRDDYCSLPLISVSEEYWARVTKPEYLSRFQGGPEGRDLDHVLVVLRISSTGEVDLYDSFQGQLSRSHHSLLGENLLPQQAIVQLPVQEVLKYWRAARYKSPWVWWVEPIDRERAAGLQRTLLGP